MVAVPIIGGALIGGGLLGKAGADAQASALKKAGKNANQTQLYMFNQQREDLAPWREAGVDSIKRLRDLMMDPEFNKEFSMADFTADPGYEFRMEEGMKALERSAAARGGVGGGRLLKDVIRFGQGAASDEYASAYNRFNNDRTTRFNRLATISGFGQMATSEIGLAGRNAANNISANYLRTGEAVGAARASGYAGIANNIADLVGGGLGGYINWSKTPGLSSGDTNYLRLIG